MPDPLLPLRPALLMLQSRPLLACPLLFSPGSSLGAGGKSVCLPFFKSLPRGRYLVPDSGPEQSLLDTSLRTFVREVGARSAAPGGGSVAAAVAALVSI